MLTLLPCQCKQEKPGSRTTCPSETTGETPVLPSRLTSGFTALTSSGTDTFIFLLFWGDWLRPFAWPEVITTQDGFQMGRQYSSMQMLEQQFDPSARTRMCEENTSNTWMFLRSLTCINNHMLKRKACTYGWRPETSGIHTVKLED